MPTAFLSAGNNPAKVCNFGQISKCGMSYFSTSAKKRTDF